MHEVSLAESMLELIQERAETEGFSKVITVWLEVGMLSCVEADAMSFCFESVVANSIASDANLEIISVAGLGKCNECHKCSPIKHLFDPCCHCGSFGLDIVQGKAVKIKSLAVQ